MISQDDPLPAQFLRRWPYSFQNLTQTSASVILKAYSFMAKKLVLLLTWFLVTPTLLLSLLFITSNKNSDKKALSNYPQITTNEFNINNNIEGQVLGTQINDFRPYIIANFLEDTPLEPHSQYIVQVSDKYGIDYRLIPAIAMKESGGGAAINQSTHNAWGWGNGKINFSSWESAIDIVGKTLKTKYIDKGLETPEQIMAVYAPPQLLTGGKWAKDISFYFSQMESL